MKSILDTVRDLNQIAELGWNEDETTKYLERIIPIKPIKMGFRDQKTGLVYKVGRGNTSILLRADIDALKTSKGVAHTCGHSTHTAALVYALKHMATQSQSLTAKDKSIYFLFQPAEETFPSGAKAFVDECENIIKQLKYAFTIHVKPLLPLGTIGLEKGAMWARGDYFEIKINGKMVHVKDSFNAIDALESASKLILEIKKIQNKFPQSVRIATGMVEGGRQPNTLADCAYLRGDIRMTKDIYQYPIKKLLNKKCRNIEKEDGTTIQFTYFDGYPAVTNNVKVTDSIIDFLASNTSFTIHQKGNFSFGCEDFAFISQKVPSVTAFIGTGDKYDLHEENCTISDQGTVNAAEYFKAVIDWFLQS